MGDSVAVCMGVMGGGGGAQQGWFRGKLAVAGWQWQWLLDSG
jgi:hypothetical protein